MNLLDLLTQRVNSLAEGDHSPGLRAVVLHVQAAMRHLDRGSQGDETAFTDAIYRANQAFEGSLKEAYRVLSQRRPDRKTPAEIESYLEENELLRARILQAMKRYRQEWRNPSTHDYLLDFDEDEALLAVINVTGFAILLLDQVGEALAFARAQAEATSEAAVTTTHGTLVDRVATALGKFHFSPGARLVETPPRESEIVGALWGYLARAIPGLEIASDVRLSETSGFRADLIVREATQTVVIEVKRQGHGKSWRNLVKGQVRHYLELADLRDGILFLFDDEPTSGYDIEIASRPNDQGSIIVISPRASAGLDRESPDA